MSWFFQSKIAKSHFYVWYLGSKEADGVRGSAVVLPVMRQLLKESFKKTPSKATVQISSKGLKLIQSVPALSRSGKVKMQLVKFQINANFITYSTTGKAPFDDVVGVVMLVLNPEMQSPMHVHCYRCDSPETAQIMLANLQLLLSRPDVQRSINDLEHRLFLSGLLVPRTAPRAQRSNSRSTSRSSSTQRTTDDDDSRNSRIIDDCSQSRRTAPRRVVEDLKNRLIGDSKFFESEKRSSLADLTNDIPNARFRVFGDTLVRESKSKSRSLDDLAAVDSLVSTNLRGGSGFDESSFNESFWKQKVRRASSIKLNF